MADALLRVPNIAEAEVLVVLVAQPVWLQRLHDSYAPNEMTLTELLVDNKKDQFSLVQGIIKQNDRIWLGHSTQGITDEGSPC